MASSASGSTEKKRAKSRGKNKVLNLGEKLRLLDRMDNNVSARRLMEEFGVSKSTYYGIIRDKEKIKDFSLKQEIAQASARKYMRIPKFNDIDSAVYKWYKQQCADGVSVRSQELKAAAERFATHFGIAVGEFKASDGWLTKFRRRHGIVNREVTGEMMSDVSAFTFGEDRKGEVGSLGAGNVVPGLNESSAGSGEGQGGCDEVSVPLSPEQFLSEEMEQGTSPPTPSSQRPESYKLRHNNHLSLVLESLAGDESFMDVTLTAQGKAIKAHKSVLSAVSPYFRSVLKENPCQHPIIIMPRDIRFEELSNIISYVYKGEMTVAAEDLSSLLKTAEILQVTGLSPSDTSSGTSGIISQMQGLPSGMFTNTSSNSSSSKTGSKKSSKQIHHQTQQLNEEMSQTAISAEGRIDPLEFLNADMTCVKEEITSENEETQDSNFPVSMDPSGSVQSITNESVGVLDSSDTPPIHHRNRHKSVGSPKSLEDPTSKPFNPGETGVSPDEGHSESSPQMGHYACPHCLEIHRPSDALHSHLRLKHPSKPSFVCACGRVFVRQSLLMDHGKKCKF